MCGRYTVTNPARILPDVLGTEDCQGLEARYNVAPNQLGPVVVASPNGSRCLVQMQWGLVPNWSKRSDIGYGMINARVETAADKPAFNHSLRQRRCIVAADGFYEWQTIFGGKYPYLFRLAGGAPFGFAGLWDYWRDPHGSLLKTYTILTTTANALVKPIHDRMPIILNRQHREEWLTPGFQANTLDRLCEPYPASAMEAVPVSSYVNSATHDSLKCVQPTQTPEIQRLLWPAPTPIEQ